MKTYEEIERRWFITEDGPTSDFDLAYALEADELVADFVADVRDLLARFRELEAERDRLRAERGDLERERGEINKALAAEVEENARLRQRIADGIHYATVCPMAEHGGLCTEVRAALSPKEPTR